MPKGIYKRTIKPDWNKGKKQTDEHKQNIKKALIGNKNCVGRKYTDETLKKMKEAQNGEKNHSWKGDEVGYKCIHKWVIRWKGQPETCEGCGETGLKGMKIHWANIDHTYKRVLDDYIRLCVPCHKKYDISKNSNKSIKQ